MIADEVKAQIALTNDEAKQVAAKQEVDPASSSIARLLADNRPHVFVAATRWMWSTLPEQSAPSAMVMC